MQEKSFQLVYAGFVVFLWFDYNQTTISLFWDGFSQLLLGIPPCFFLAEVISECTV